MSAHAAALRLFNAGDPRGAARALAAAARRDPSDAEARFFLSQALAALGRRARAETALAAALALRPRRAGWWLAAADLSAARGDLDEALDRCRRASALEPSDSSAREREADLLLRAGRAAEAERALGRALARRPSPELRRKAARLLAARDPAAALRHLRRAGGSGADDWLLRARLERRPAAAAAAFSRAALAARLPQDAVLAARGLLDLGRAREAARARARARVLGWSEERVARALAGDAVPEDALAQRAQQAEVTGHAAEAGRLYLRLLAAPGGREAACLGLARLAAAAGRDGEASRRLSAARRERPEGLTWDWFSTLAACGRFAEAFALGDRLARRGLTPSALRCLWNPWVRQPSPAQRAAWSAELRRLSRRGRLRDWAALYRAQLDPGEDSLEGVRALAPKGARSWMWLRAGWSLLHAGRFEEAARRLERAARQRPRDWKARGYLAEAHLGLGRPARALAQLRAAEREAPASERAAALAWRGELLLWEGRYPEALSALTRACDGGAQHAFCWRAAARLLLGEARAALAELDEVRRRFPLDAEARVWRAEALRRLGRPREALRALERPPLMVWERVNRGLCRAALGDGAGVVRELSALPDRVRETLLRGVGGRPDDPKAARLALELALRAARGLRREDLGHALWLRRL